MREEQTLEEIAAQWNVSKARIYQIEKRALKKLRAYCDAIGLNYEDLTSTTTMETNHAQPLRLTEDS
ncbi:sigma factor-like helix-turn-helix DNA-binding protein [uncultured Thiodictyon sp.]|uniref:sigma factor-like helix-turn-helix DNA-binding protein n=1 Tax=uncultured Thiodictyon sp. TaxID=1846217 RepID=UPI00345359DB